MWYAAWMFPAENGRVINLHYMSSAALSRSSVLGQIEPGTVSMMRWSWGQVKSEFLSCLQMKKGSSTYIWWHFSKTNMWVCFVFRKQTDLLKHRWCLSSNKQQQEPVMVMFFVCFFIHCGLRPWPGGMRQKLNNTIVRKKRWDTASHNPAFKKEAFWNNFNRQMH